MYASEAQLSTCLNTINKKQQLTYVKTATAKVTWHKAKSREGMRASFQEKDYKVCIVGTAVNEMCVRSLHNEHV